MKNKLPTFLIQQFQNEQTINKEYDFKLNSFYIYKKNYNINIKKYHNERQSLYIIGHPIINDKINCDYIWQFLQNNELNENFIKSN